MHSIVQVAQTATVYDLTTVEMANQYLNITPSTAGDAIMAAQITSASQIIANQCDRVFAMEDVVETFVMKWGECIEALKCDRFPIIDVASIEDCGQQLADTEFDWNATTGVIWRRTESHFMPWPYWRAWNGGRIIVSYTGGYNLPSGAPADLALACLLLIKEQRFAQLRGDPTIRSLQHADSAIFYQQGSQAYAIGQGALPPAVSQLIAPYKEPAAA